MTNYFEKLRQKPDSTKKWVAFLVAFSFTGVVFVVWLTVLYPNFREENKIAQKVPSQDPTPLSTLSSIFTQGTSAVSKQISDLNNIGNSATTSVATSTESTSTNAQ